VKFEKVRGVKKTQEVRKERKGWVTVYEKNWGFHAKPAPGAGKRKEGATEVLAEGTHWRALIASDTGRRSKVAKMDKIRTQAKHDNFTWGGKLKDTIKRNQ